MTEHFQSNNTIALVREYTFQILDENENTNMYTNINRLYRIEKNIKKIITEDNIKDIDINSLLLANYIITIEHAENLQKIFDVNSITAYINKISIELKEKFNLESMLSDKATQIAIESIPTNQAKLIEAQVLSDSGVMDFACEKGRDRMKLMYEEMLLKDIEISKENWYDTIIPILDTYNTYTNYGKEKVAPAIEKLSKNLKKEIKEIENRNDLVLQKELKISDEEIKKLKKDLSKVKDRDDRGIQTLFRTTSKNHYTLNQMVDGKARIMITVNSIILSLILGGIIGNFDKTQIIKYLPVFVFTIFNLISIIFAIIAITPLKTQGNFTEEDIRSKKGNLLYFGNFHNMNYRDFEWGFLQLLNDKNYLYTSMIRDYYYQAQGLNKKYRHIRISLYAFIIGLCIAIFMQLLYNGLNLIW